MSSDPLINRDIKSYKIDTPNKHVIVCYCNRKDFISLGVKPSMLAGWGDSIKEEYLRTEINENNDYYVKMEAERKSAWECSIMNHCGEVIRKLVREGTNIKEKSQFMMAILLYLLSNVKQRRRQEYGIYGRRTQTVKHVENAKEYLKSRLKLQEDIDIINQLGPYI